MVPSWNITITSITSSSLAVKWSDFPLSIPVKLLLVKYTELNSNVSLVYLSSTRNTTHGTGNVLKGFQFYEVKVIAVTTVAGNRSYSSEAVLARTDEAG